MYAGESVQIRVLVGKICDFCGKLCPGVILQRVQSPTAPLSPKLSRTDLPSDDEVQVVTEWLVPSVEEGRSDVLEATTPPLHVPVIQRPSEAKTTPSQDRDEVRVWFWSSKQLQLYTSFSMLTP